MSIPNTTPTPNKLFNSEMIMMKDTELRVVMVVTRATFGWVIDKKTGLRKTEDWISLSQMVKRSGKSERALNMAIKSCVEKGWIETRSEDGRLLDTPEKRMKHGKKIYYRLGEKFLKDTPANNAEVYPRKYRQPTPANNASLPPQNLRATKETLTKETLTESTQSNKNFSNGEIHKRKTLLNNRLAGKPWGKPEWLLNLGDEDITFHQEEFPELSADKIRDEARSSYYWQKTKGQWKKDNRSFLRNWLKNSNKFNKEKKGGISFHEYK